MAPNILTTGRFVYFITDTPHLLTQLEMTDITLK